MFSFIDEKKKPETGNDRDLNIELKVRTSTRQLINYYQ